LVLKEAIRSTAQEDKSISLALEDSGEDGVVCKISYSPDAGSFEELELLAGSKNNEQLKSTLGTARAVLSDQGAKLSAYEEKNSKMKVVAISFPVDGA
jgi:hypothetical protein